jgi:hypothetical protein
MTKTKTPAKTPSLFTNVTGITTPTPKVSAIKSGIAVERVTAPLDIFINNVRDNSVSKVDFMEPTEGWLRIKEQGGKIVAPNGVYLNDFAIKSLAGYTELPTTLVDYFLHTHPDLDRLCYEANWGLDVRKAKIDGTDSKRYARKYLMRNRLDTDGNPVCRVVVTDQYAILNNVETLEILRKALPVNSFDDARTSYTYDNGDDMICDIILPDYVKTNKNAEYGVIVGLKNSEITKYTFVLEPGIFEANTGNTYMWNKTGSKFKINVKHRGEIDRATLQNSAVTVVQMVLTEGENLITQLNYLKDIKITNIAELIFLLAKERSISKNIARQWYKNYWNYYGDANNSYGLVSALAHTAKKFEGDEKRKIETTASLIMTPALDAEEAKVQKLWKAYASRATEIDKDDISDFLEEL